MVRGKYIHTKMISVSVVTVLNNYFPTKISKMEIYYYTFD